jgi:DNA-binding CsgD family transcriptional regulator
MVTPIEDRQAALDVLDALYGGVLAGPSWEPFLRALGQWLEATYATLVLAAPGQPVPGEVLTPDIDPQRNDAYAEGLFATDPFVGLPEGEVVAFTEFMNGRRMDDDWRRFLEDNSYSQVLGVDIRAPSGLEARFRLTRNRSRPDFGQEERHALRALVPHLRHAIALSQRLQASAIEHGVYRGAMEQMAVAAYILDHRGRVLQSNAVAERLTAAGDGLSLRGGFLVLGSRSAQSELERLLREPPAAGEMVRLRLPRASGARDLNISVRSTGQSASMGEGQPALALFIGDPDQKPRASPEALRDLFQLTRMEAALAVALADGSSLIEAANKLGIAHNTARSHLRATFSKTGAHRQSQLVRLVQASLAELSGSDGPN